MNFNLFITDNSLGNQLLFIHSVDEYTEGFSSSIFCLCASFPIGSKQGKRLHVDSELE